MLEFEYEMTIQPLVSHLSTARSVIPSNVEKPVGEGWRMKQALQLAANGVAMLAILWERIAGPLTQAEAVEFLGEKG